MRRMLKRDVEEFCHGCGLLLRHPRSGYYCFIYSHHKKKGEEGIPDGDVSELPESLKEYLGIPADATGWPDTCKDFTSKAETRYVLRMEDHKIPLTFSRLTPEGYKTDIVGWSHYSGVLTVEPLGYSKWVGGEDGVQWFLENNKHIPIEMEQPVETEQ